MFIIYFEFIIGSGNEYPGYLQKSATTIPLFRCFKFSITAFISWTNTISKIGQIIKIKIFKILILMMYYIINTFKNDQKVKKKLLGKNTGKQLIFSRKIEVQ